MSVEHQSLRPVYLGERSVNSEHHTVFEILHHELFGIAVPAGGHGHGIGLKSERVGEILPIHIGELTELRAVLIVRVVYQVAVLLYHERASRVIHLYLGSRLLQQVETDIHTDYADRVIAVEIRYYIGYHIHAEIGVKVWVHPHRGPALDGDIIPADVFGIVLIVDAHIGGERRLPRIVGEVYGVPEAAR